FAPDAGEPGLLLVRQAGGPIVMLDFLETRAREEALPLRQVVIGAIAAAKPAFLILAAGIGREQHTARAKRGMELLQDPGQFAAGNVKQGGVGEEAVKPFRRQIEI